MSAALFSSLYAAVALILIISIASERLVEIIKGFIPFLSKAFEDSKREGYRRAALQILAMFSGCATAWLAAPIISTDQQNYLDHPGQLLGIGLLASGGSGLWNAVLSYFLQLKDLKKAEVQNARSSVLLKNHGVFADLNIAQEQVTSNNCYDVGE